jgi:hypothetical protein
MSWKCRATWCDNDAIDMPKAYALKCFYRWRDGDKSIAAREGARAYDVLMRAQRQVRVRATWHCAEHIKMLETYGFIMCRVEGCEKQAKGGARGLCGTHYQRWMTHGTTDGSSPKVFPVAPLVALLDEMGGWENVMRGKPTGMRERLQKALTRGKETGHVTVPFADCLAIEVLGLHPALVWGDDWWDEKAMASV